MRYPFTLRQLEVFANLAQSASFRRSAEVFGISQASISNQIKALEEQLGVKLFLRQPGKTPTLTDEGVTFLEDLNRFQVAGDALAAHRRGANQTPGHRKFRVMIGEILLASYVRPKLDRLHAAVPDVEIVFEPSLPTTLNDFDLIESRFDFALIHSQDAHLQDARFRSIAMVRSGIFGHVRFARDVRTPLDPKAVEELPFILPQADSKQARAQIKALASLGIRPRNIVSRSQYFDVICSMVEQGRGLAVLPEPLLPRSAREKVVMLKLMSYWHLCLFRKELRTDAICDAVETFLVSSVLDDPDYPRVDSAGLLDE